MSIKNLQRKAIELKVEAIEMIHRAGSGHSGASASSMDILVALYYGELGQERVMNYDPTSPGWPEQDYFVLSKYTAGAALYSVLADVGYFDKKDLAGFRSLNGRLRAFPHVKISGVHATIGSRGHGLSVATGMALSLKADKKKNRVFTLIEDQELQVGQTWEAALTAGHHKLERLTAIVEYSGMQSDGVMRSVMNIEPLVEKFESFGWRALKVNDGHDFDQILDMLQKARTVKRRPTVLICKTVLAKGIPFAEGKSLYYGAALGEEEMKEFVNHSEKIWHRV